MITIRLETPDQRYLLDPDSIIADLTERFPGTRVTVENYHERRRESVRKLVDEYAAKGKQFLIEKRVLEEIEANETRLGPAREISIPLNDQGDEIEGMVAASRVLLQAKVRADFETVRTIADYLNSLTVGQLFVRDDEDQENQRRLKTLSADQQMQLDGGIDFDELLLPPRQREAVECLRKAGVRMSAGIKQGALNFQLGILEMDETDHLWESMRELEPLVKLSIQNTTLTERGLATLAGLPRLNEIHLRNTTTPGWAFRHLTSFPQLTKLWIDEMELDDTALAAIGELHGLRQLRFRDTSLSDAGFRQLAYLQNLSALNLHRVPVNEGLQELAALEQLTFLGLSVMPQVTGEILAMAGQLSRLEGLSLEMATLTDQDLAHLRGLKQLWRMSLHYTGEDSPPRVTAAGIRAFADLPELKQLTLIKVPLNAAGFRELGQLTQLRYLGLNLPGVPTEWFEELKTQLPECHVSWVEPERKQG
ncbi:leucine-rich repeat domain-containing protein [Gimesia algae]|uniref:Leucine Rich repeats (2 copies) n=1 Tax=Gimesia algae TaxID=2527971 RepID=A0A517VDM2_9PLAN|nr:hypothetical protein [Gimesia algae]QDT91104.1 Leucine Rich repeats (2 copies) [Gimesia algae]